MHKRTFLKISVLAAATALSLPLMAYAENATLKVGFVGVTSGPAAAWGISNQRSMEARAAWLNELGGVKIGDKTYNIEIVAFDDQKDPKRAIAGMEKMAQDGIHYVVGPNVDDGAAAVRPVAEQNGIMYFPYSFPKALFSPPASSAYRADRTPGAPPSASTLKPESSASAGKPLSLAACRALASAFSAKVSNGSSASGMPRLP